MSVQPKGPGLARRTIGIALLATTVFLWTAGNFLLSNILADDSYSKPYFVTYVNTAFFSLFLVIVGARKLLSNLVSKGNPVTADHRSAISPPAGEESESFLHASQHAEDDENAILIDDSLSRIQSSSSQALVSAVDGRLTTQETAYLALEFCLLWFFANFTLAAGLEYTSVGSSTVLTATSSMWTLLFGAIFKVERFSLVKLLGVIISLTGITLISMIDLSGNTDKHRGNFPHKSPGQVALGDMLSLLSAMLYGIYTVFMKKRIGTEDRIDMLLFFGFVGVINTVTLWPGMLFLHFVGLESFELPPTSTITSIIFINSIVSVAADLCWAYAVVMTSPLVVTVGLSMSIPLALLGQMIIHSSTSSIPYWIGALLVFAAFGLINHESKQAEQSATGVEVRPNRLEPRED